ncbi:30S ribosomal protein S16 [Candidatus Peregrinibacteria bacterium]|nr:30S ribosomal protein S16 [Candidatus Peregrinibacteria bacterium]
MLRIRLSRTGKKAQKSFRITVAEHTKSPKKKTLEVLGHYLPTRNPKVLEYDKERVMHWIGKGAQPSETVASLLKKDGVDGMDKFIFFKPDKKKKKKNAPDEEPEAEEKSAPKEESKEEAPASAE